MTLAQAPQGEQTYPPRLSFLPRRKIIRPGRGCLVPGLASDAGSGMEPRRRRSPTLCGQPASRRRAKNMSTQQRFLWRSSASRPQESRLMLVLSGRLICGNDPRFDPALRTLRALPAQSIPAAPRLRPPRAAPWASGGAASSRRDLPAARRSSGRAAQSSPDSRWGRPATAAGSAAPGAAATACLV